MTNTDAQLTDQLYAYVRQEGIDVFGIADIDLLNARARAGRRPRDLFPQARAVLVFGCGMMDSFSRGWAHNGPTGDFFALTLLELENRCWRLKRFLRARGYHYYGGTIYGGGVLGTGMRLAEAAASCGLGYVGKSNLLITEKYGPRLNLLYLATDAPLRPDCVPAPSQCGACRMCERKCLSGAILGEGYFHARQCESIVNAKPNKRYYNANMNQDCDRCLRFCPKGTYHWKGEHYED